MAKLKTPDYTRRAIEKYRAEKWNLSVLLPGEYKNIIGENEKSANGYINRLVREDLTRRGLLPGAGSESASAESSSAWGGMV